MGLEEGVEGGVSDFLISFTEGLAAAPKGFEKSGAGLAGVPAESVDACPGPMGGEIELDENFELILDIHEFRLLGGPSF